MAMWNDMTEEQLVNLVEERPALYDLNDRNYNNRMVRAELWRDIQLKLNGSEKEMKRRWESLRTQFARYLRLPPTGRTARQDWILSKLHFLEPHTKLKAGVSQISEKDSFSGDFDCASEAHSDAPWTCALAEVCPQSPAPESAPIDSPALPLHSESTHHHHHAPQSRLTEPTAAAAPPALGENRAGPQSAKRFRRDDSAASETAASLMAAISRTLGQLMQEKEVKEDGISIYLKYLEHRMRGLPQHHLPRLQRDIENLLFTYSVEENKTDL